MKNKYISNCHLVHGMKNKLYISNCHLVHGMTVIEEYLKWDDEDSKNKDKDYGAHPFDDGGSRDHKLHFCYYSPDRSRIIG
ncbi:hypothetical protein SNE40_013528 [Patella caerulea]|uniref:Apextrin C-terminal domain-containing protein n=1 Tax=Patella caerulea TaxID=87958 RepID=A0AAN8JG37_PATCE